MKTAEELKKLTLQAIQRQREEQQLRELREAEQRVAAAISTFDDAASTAADQGRSEFCILTVNGPRAPEVGLVKAAFEPSGYRVRTQRVQDDYEDFEYHIYVSWS